MESENHPEEKVNTIILKKVKIILLLSNKIIYQLEKSDNNLET